MVERKCNECTLCCRLVPVGELRKPANTPCRHQTLKGCSIYLKSNLPLSCRLWSCRWLVDPTLPLQRPDRSHYVIDTMPDFIHINGIPVSVVQIWVDPRFPQAHHDPQLREWIMERFHDKNNPQLALIRFDSSRAVVLSPPELNGTQEWIEMDAQCSATEHTAEEIAEQLAEARKLFT